MEKVIRFKKNWEEGFIRINMIDGAKIEIDTPLYLFQKRFQELIEVPNIRFKSRKLARKIVLEAVMEAFELTVKEMKEETKRV